MNVTTGGQLQVQVSLVTRSTDLEVSWGEGKERAEGGSGYKFNLNYHVSSVCGITKHYCGYWGYTRGL